MLSESLLLSATGAGFVFLFLAFLIVVIHFMSFVVRRFVTLNSTVQSNASQLALMPADVGTEQLQVAAIIAATTHHQRIDSHEHT